MSQAHGVSRQSSGGRPPRAVPFGKYLLLDRIAVGGMAEVFLAKSFGIEGFEKFVAIKRILPTMAEDEDFIEMFIDEAKIAGQLTHANIVPIYELGKIGESHYIAMEYVWGKDLLQVMNRFRRMRRRPSPAMVAFVGIKVCEGLDYAHHKTDRQGRPLNLIHRDVSPQNILLSYEGHVKVIDFGIAKAASRTTKTQAGVLKGKFGYMSPEQVRGLPIDHRSDVFALGTCLHEFTTGERLFLGESDFTTLEKVRNADVRPPSTVVQGVPPELDRIIMKALAREPEDRWQTAGEMQEALQRFLATQRPPFGTSKLAQWMKSAFAKEIDEERQRMEQCAALGRPQAVGGGAQAPAPPPPAIGDEPDELEGEATVVSASPFEMLEALERGEAPPAAAGPVAEPLPEMQEEKTVIFFSADEMDIVEEASFPGASGGGPAAPAPQPMPAPQPAAPQPAAGLVPPPAVGAQQAAMGFAPPPEPVPQAVFSPPPPDPAVSGVASAPLATEATAGGRQERAGGRRGLLIGLAALLVLGVFGGAAALLMGRGGAALKVTVRPSDAKGLRIEVDGKELGGSPASLSGLEPGPHVLQVHAEGYEPIVRRLELSDGAMLALELSLTPKVEEQLAAAAQPAGGQPAPPSAGQGEAPEQGGAAAAGQGAQPDDEPSGGAASGTPSPAGQPSPSGQQDGQPSRPQAARDTGRASGERSGRTAPTATDRGRTGRAAREGSGSASRTSGRATARDGSEARPARRGSGTLVIQTIPWARVFLDGRDTRKNTPLPRLRVRAGHHVVGLRTPDGKMHKVEVDVEPGQTVRIIKRLQ